MDLFFGRDGKTVILPIDHGTAIPVPGMEDPIGLIEETSPHVDGYVVKYIKYSKFGVLFTFTFISKYS